MSSNSFILTRDDQPNSFAFTRGSAFMSAFGFGSELWFKHHIDVKIKQKSEKETLVTWRINMKLFGLQGGENAIIEECKQLLRENP
jgi:hypothetical protein